MACTIARKEVWAQVPQLVMAAMNSVLMDPIRIGKLHEAMKTLPLDKAPKPDGFQTNIFLALWGTLSKDLLHSIRKPSNLGPYIET